MAKKSSRHSMYKPRILLKRWRLEKLTVDQAIGQLILRIIDLIKRLARVKSRQVVFQQQLRHFNTWLQTCDERLGDLEERLQVLEEQP